MLTAMAGLDSSLCSKFLWLSVAKRLNKADQGQAKKDGIGTGCPTRRRRHRFPCFPTPRKTSKTRQTGSTRQQEAWGFRPNKAKVMKPKNKNATKTNVRGVELEEVQHFRYLGSYISADSNIEKEISTKIGLAAQTFSLQNICGILICAQAGRHIQLREMIPKTVTTALLSIHPVHGTSVLSGCPAPVFILAPVLLGDHHSISTKAHKSRSIFHRISRAGWTSAGVQFSQCAHATQCWTSAALEVSAAVR
ncbi:hypothetical protein SRHO_G00000100 [Serrasalmus rhombeus]